MSFTLFMYFLLTFVTGGFSTEQFLGIGNAFTAARLETERQQSGSSQLMPAPLPTTPVLARIPDQQFTPIVHKVVPVYKSPSKGRLPVR